MYLLSHIWWSLFVCSSKCQFGGAHNAWGCIYRTSSITKIKISCKIVSKILKKIFATIILFLVCCVLPRIHWEEWSSMNPVWISDDSRYANARFVTRPVLVTGYNALKSSPCNRFKWHGVRFWIKHVANFVSRSRRLNCCSSALQQYHREVEHKYGFLRDKKMCKYLAGFLMNNLEKDNLNLLSF